MKNHVKQGQDYLRSFLACVPLSVLIGCGGGGGGGGGSTVTQPDSPPQNTAPSFTTSLNLMIPENETVVGPIEASDADGDAISISISGGEDATFFALSGDDRLVFVEAPDFETPRDSNGDNEYRVELSVSDGSAQTAVTFTVEVVDVADAVNSAPIATDNVNSVSEDGTLIAQGNVITDNDGAGVDSDPDEDSLTIASFAGGDQFGNLTLSETGTYTYTLNNALDQVQALNSADQLEEVYTYTITDGALSSEEAKLTITIKGKDESQDILLTLQQPATDNTLVGDAFTVVVSASSTFELSSVTARIAELTRTLSYSNEADCSRGSCQPGFVGTFDLSGKPSGSYELRVEAIDARGVSNTVTRLITIDRAPFLAVENPLALSVARPVIEAAARCEDRESVCEITLELLCDRDAFLSECPGYFAYSGDGSISESLDLAMFDGQALTLRFSATDAAGQVTSESRTVIVETSPYLQSLALVEGEILDADNERILYQSDSGMFLTPVGSTQPEEIDLPSLASISTATLSLTGALIVGSPGSITTATLFDYNEGGLFEFGPLNSAQSVRTEGRYAIYNENASGGSGKRLTRRDLVGKSNQIISENAGNFRNDVNDIGEVVFWEAGSYRVIKSDGASSEVVGSDPNLWATYPLIGDNIVLYRLHDPCCSNQRYAIMLWKGGSSEVLSDFRDTEPSPLRDYTIEGDWVGFTDLGASGQLQVWSRSPQGARRQRSIFGTSSALVKLSDDGEIIFSNEGNLFSSEADGTYADLEISNAYTKVWGKFAGQWILSIGRELFVIGSSQ